MTNAFGVRIEMNLYEPGGIPEVPLLSINVTHEVARVLNGKGLGVDRTQTIQDILSKNNVTVESHRLPDVYATIYTLH